EKVQKIAAGEEGNYRMERVPLKQTDRHHKSPGGDLCIRDRLNEGLLNHNLLRKNVHAHVYLSSVTENSSSEHLLAKINSDLRLISEKS
ncbi:hypothetical protein ACP81E_16595, partial [Escherichia coli]